MSLRTKKDKRSGLCFSSGGFSSKSVGSTNTAPKSSTPNNMIPIRPVTVNTSLLTPLKTDIDPVVQALRTEEKEQIKGLNNRFASYIKKVQLLEQENKMLETKWQLLQNQTSTSYSFEHMYKAYIDNLQKQLDLAHSDTRKLEREKDACLSQVDNYKTKYEEESNRKIHSENVFVELKKDVDEGFIAKEKLQMLLSSLMDEFDFLKAVYEAEMREIQANLKETSVVVEMDNSRSLDMDQIVSEVKAQYEEIAARSREEAESWYRTKFDLMTAEANQYDTEVHSTKGQIAELKRMISGLQHQIDAIKAQRATIDSRITETEERGQQAVSNANIRIKELEKALMEAKHLMAKQVREYQELMNIKLALDIEISTYMKLMEGEEDRYGQKTVVNVRSAPIRNVTSAPSTNVSSAPVKTVSSAPSQPNHQRRRSGPILIKTVETSELSYN